MSILYRHRTQFDSVMLLLGPAKNRQCCLSRGSIRSRRFHTSLQHLHLLRISGQRTVPDRNLRDGTGCDHDAVAVNGSAKRPDELPLMERLAKFQAAQAAGNNVT